MKIAILAVDNRSEFKCYEGSAPMLPFAVADLLRGFVDYSECEMHVISCVKKPLPSPVVLASNITFHSVEVGQLGWLRTLYSGCVLGIRKKLCDIRPDIVHGQGTERYCGLAAVLSGYPNVITVHGNVRKVAASLNSRLFSFLWLTARLEQFSLSRTNGVLSLSTYGRNLVQSCNKRVWQIPNAVNTAFFNVSRCPDGKTILCLADILAHKNQIGLIEALDGWEPIRRYKLVFAGKLPDKSSYAKQFLELVKERSWCSYDGSVERSRIRELLQKAEALIHPSFEDNCPMAILEAMAVGVTVAASNIGGIPDIIRDHYNGLLFDPLSPESIRQAVRMLLDEPELNRDLGLRGKATVAEHHSPRGIALQHIQAYREILA